MKHIQLTAEQAVKYRHYMITSWWGIDPIQIAPGVWVLDAEMVDKIEGLRDELKEPKEIAKADTVLAELKAIPVKDQIDLDIEKDYPTVDEDDPTKITYNYIKPKIIER